MASIRLALRSSVGLNAYRSMGSGVASLLYNSANPAPTVATPGGLTGVFGGGQVIDISATTGVRAITYGAGGNVAPATGFAVLTRIVPKFSGSPSTTQCLFSIGGFGGNDVSALILYLTSTGLLEIDYFNSGGNLVISADLSGFVFTAGVATDIMFSWDGTTGTGKMRLSQDGVLVASVDVPAGQGISDGKFRPEQITTIYIGGDTNVVSSNYYLNEFVVFDYGENPVYATRTTYWPTTALDYAASTDAGASNVKHGVGYNFQGTSETGTYRGADLWTALAPADVTEGLSYLADGASLVGTKDEPDPADVREGVVYDGGTLTGTLQVVVTTQLTLEALAPNVASGVVTCTAGDRLVLSLLLKNGAAPVDLTGATFSTAFVGGLVVAGGTPDPDQVTHRGQVLITVPTTDSATLKVGAVEEVIVQVTQGASVLFFHGKVLTVLSPTPGKNA